LPEGKFSGPGDPSEDLFEGQTMSQRSRTVAWCQSRILKELAKRSMITTTLALSAIVLEDVRSLEEDHNLDVAVQLLKSRELIQVKTDRDGFTTYSLAA